MSGGDNFGIHRGAARPQDDRTQGQILSDFLLQLEDYTPTVSFHFVEFINFFFGFLIVFFLQIPDAVTSHYLNTAGFEANDPRM